jgi:hypothetical protein
MTEGSGSGGGPKTYGSYGSGSATLFYMDSGGEWPDGEHGITLVLRPHCAAGSPQLGRPSARTSWVSPSPPSKEYRVHEEGRPFCHLRTTVKQMFFFRMQCQVYLDLSQRRNLYKEHTDNVITYTILFFNLTNWRICRPNCTLQKPKVVFFLFLCASAFFGYRKIRYGSGPKSSKKIKRKILAKTKWRVAHDLYTVLHRFIWTFPSQKIACV